MNAARICHLQGCLDDAGLDGTDRVLRVFREAGMLPAGRAGRAGVGSATIGPQHAALVLLGLASLAWSEPHETPREATRLAEFRRLPRRDFPLIDVLSNAIIDAARDSGSASWWVSQWAVACERKGEAPVRFMAADAPAGNVFAVRETVLDGALIAAVGRLFAGSQRRRRTDGGALAPVALLRPLLQAQPKAFACIDRLVVCHKQLHGSRPEAGERPRTTRQWPVSAHSGRGRPEGQRRKMPLSGR